MEPQRGSAVDVSGTRLDCNAVHLNGEASRSAFTFYDAGGNVCGCGEALVPGAVRSTTLAPPEPIP